MGDGDASPQVSSLYGPGAYICWLSTVLSVTISWLLNPSSRQKDTITNDFIAAVTLPIVAALHSFIQSARDTDTQNATSKATLSICRAYSIFGTYLLLIACEKERSKRPICVLSVAMLCVVARLAALFSPAVTFDPIEMYTISWEIALLVAVIFHHQKVQPRLHLYLVRAEIRAGAQTWWILLCWKMRHVFAFVGNVPILGAVLLSLSVLPFLQGNSVRGAIVPVTPYSVADLDQAVALAAGVITLLMGIRDARKAKRVESGARDE